MSGHTFTSPHALKFMSRLENYIRNHGQATCAHCAAHFGLSLATIERYVHELWQSGRICKAGTRAGAVLWELGCDPDALEYEDTKLVPHQDVIQKWAPNHVRSMFDCLLFGTPDVMREAA